MKSFSARLAVMVLCVVLFFSLSACAGGRRNADGPSAVISSSPVVSSGNGLDEEMETLQADLDQLATDVANSDLPLDVEN